ETDCSGSLQSAEDNDRDGIWTVDVLRGAANEQATSDMARPGNFRFDRTGLPVRAASIARAAVPRLPAIRCNRRRLPGGSLHLLHERQRSVRLRQPERRSRLSEPARLLENLLRRDR